MCAWAQLHRANTGDEVDALISIVALGLEVHAIEPLASGEVPLREGRPLIGWMGLARHERYGSLPVNLADAVARTPSGKPATDDNILVRLHLAPPQ